MLNFNYSNHEKVSKIFNVIDNDNTISEEQGAALIHLSSLTKLLCLAGAKVKEIRIEPRNQMYLFAAFKTTPINSKVSLTKTVGKEFDITNTAMEKNVGQCFADREYIFRNLAKVFDGTGKFFKNTANAIKLVNNYFDSKVSGNTLYTIEEFAVANYGQNWQNDKRAESYVKVLEATCGTVNRGDIAWNFGAVYSSLIEVMEQDKEFLPKTKPGKYVDNKYDSIVSVQEMLSESAEAMESTRVVNIDNYDVSEDRPYVREILVASAAEVNEESFINAPIEAPSINY